MWDAFHACEKDETCPGLVTNTCTDVSQCADKDCNDKDCVDGTCTYTSVTDGTYCTNDNLWCTGQESCQSGSCESLYPAGDRGCTDDGITCTVEACSEANQNCTITYNHADCQNPDTCIINEACTASGCTYNTITQCIPDDNCCPTQCTEAIDNDCVPFPQDYTTWFRLDETSGTTFADASGSNQGTCTNCPTPTPGLKDGAQHFDGDDYITIQNLAEGFTDYSISLWFRAESLGGFLFANDEVTNWYTSAATNRWDTRMTHTMDRDAQLFNNDPALNTWYHYVFVRDGVNDYKIVYRDTAVLVSKTPTFHGPGIQREGPSKFIGESGDGNPFEGIIDNFMIYDRVLIEQEIQQIYCSQGGTTDCDTTQCNTGADQIPCDGCVNSGEIGDYVDIWYANSAQVSMVQLVRALEQWKLGGC